MKFTQSATPTTTAMAIAQAINAPSKRALAILTDERLLPPMQGHNTFNFEASILCDENNYRIGLRIKPGTDLAEVRSMLAHLSFRGFSFYVGGFTNGLVVMGWTSVYATRQGFNPWESKSDYASATEIAALTVPSNTDLALHLILGSIQFPESVDEMTTPDLDAPPINSTPELDALVDDYLFEDAVIPSPVIELVDEPANAEELMEDGLRSMSKKQLIQICDKHGYSYRKSHTKAQLAEIIAEAELADDSLIADTDTPVGCVALEV